MIVAYFCLFVAAISVWSYRTFGLAGVSVGDYIIEQTIVANKEIIWTQEMENNRLEALKPKKKVIEKVVVKDIDVPKTKIVLSDKVQVVACLNERNMTIHQPNN